MELFYKKIGHGHPLIVMHGLMGMLDNWATPAKVLAQHFEVYLVDQRNHGHSPHSDDFSYQEMSDDLYEFIITHQLEGAVELKIIHKRSDADKILKQYVSEVGVRQFLLKNLYWPEKGRLAWRFNLNVISETIEQIGEAINDRQYDGETLFIRGERSNYIQDSDKEMIDIYFPNAEIETIANAGHWVHAEQPDHFLECILDFLK